MVPHKTKVVDFLRGSFNLHSTSHSPTNKPFKHCNHNTRHNQCQFVVPVYLLAILLILFWRLPSPNSLFLTLPLWLFVIIDMQFARLFVHHHSVQEGRGWCKVEGGRFWLVSFELKSNATLVRWIGGGVDRTCSAALLLGVYTNNTLANIKVITQQDDNTTDTAAATHQCHQKTRRQFGEWKGVNLLLGGKGRKSQASDL